MTGPRELTYLVPADVLAAVENAVAALETHGPVVTEALRQLDRATTLAWKAVNLVEPTTNGSSSSTRSASTVAGMRPTSWSPPSMCLARSRPPT